MNEVYDINKNIGRSFLKTGIVILSVTLALFVVNSIKGYTKVSMLKTIDNCTVRTHYTHANGVSNYYTEVRQFDEDSKGWKTVYDGNVGYFYYARMKRYTSSRITLYETSWGEKFPVFKVDCNKWEAERAYRKLRPPIIWYAVYGIGLAAGFSFCWMGRAGKKSADNYKDKTVYETPVSFDDM